MAAPLGGETYHIRTWFFGETGFDPGRIDLDMPEPNSEMTCPVSFRAIHIKFDDRWDSFILAHEYGHWIMCSGYDGQNPSSSYGGREHTLFSEYDGGKALTEGWAEFISFIWSGDENGNAEQTQPDWSGRHWEDGPQNQGDENQYNGDWFIWDGNEVEGAVLGIFWDIWDSTLEAANRVDMNGDSLIYLPVTGDMSSPLDPTDPDEPLTYVGGDSMQVPLSWIWAILDNDNPNDMKDFWRHWFSTTDDTVTNYQFHRELLAIFFDHGIPDPDGDGTPNNAAPSITEFALLSPTCGSVNFGVDIDPVDGDQVDWRLEYSANNGVSWAAEQIGIWTGAPIEVSFDSRSHPHGASLIFRLVAHDGILGVVSPIPPAVMSVVINNPPPITLTASESHTGGVWTSHLHPQFAWSTMDCDISGFEYRIVPGGDNGQIFPLGPAQTELHTDVPDGTHEFDVRAVDMAGQTGAWSDRVVVYIDTVSPGITLLSQSTTPSSPETPDPNYQSDWNRPTFAWQFLDPIPTSGPGYVRFEASSSNLVDAGGYFLPGTLIASLDWSSTQGGSMPSQCAYGSCYTTNMPKGWIYWHVLGGDRAGNGNAWSANGQTGNTIWGYVNTNIHESIVDSPAPPDVTWYSAHITWSPNTANPPDIPDHDFLNYRVRWATPNFATGTANLGPPTASYVPAQTSYTVKLVCGTPYEFNVRTYDTAGYDKDSSNSVFAVTGSGITPPPVTLYNPTGVGSHGMSVEWTAYPVGDFARYELIYDDDDGFGSPSMIIITDQGTLKKHVSGLQPGTPYYLKVRVVSTCPGFSSESGMVSATTTNPNGNLKGYIYDMDGSPLVSIRVEVWFNGVLIASAYSGGSGSYKILSPLPTSTWLDLVVVDESGCLDFVLLPPLDRVFIQDGQTVERDFHATEDCS